MVGTKADSVPGTYRKYAGGNPVSVRPTSKWQKGIGEFFRLSPKDSEKENLILEEAGRSGLGRAKRKVCPLQPDHTDDEKNRTWGFQHGGWRGEIKSLTSPAVQA
ncbi:PCLAF-like [Ictidomys tridecemlineatus]|uniref:PCNA-associated factor n=1 Tax=Ictidomys tridecemlineatus TaxID=43179 RepID=A0A287D8B5_ICTTR|nr:PCLAF-like [Ictidomys tridecemlineatus]